MGLCEELDRKSASVYRSESCFEWNLQSISQYVLHVRYISTASIRVEETNKKAGALCLHFQTYKVIRNGPGHTRTHTST